MYNYGFFRNIDTSIDPLGQQYKVCIFTDGEMYTFDRYGSPIQREIKLSGNPFVVDYSGDNNNIYKPYKCSTATIGLILEKVDNQFISKGKCDILVKLLKKKNDVVLVLGTTGEYYQNTTTGDKLFPASTIGQRPSFSPEEVDNFCFDTEWVGYATPNTYNQDYTKVIEEYDMECQDALSTLRYFNYSNTTVGVHSFGDSILKSFAQLPNNPITTIYITNTLKLATADSKPITDYLKSINENWVDEDYEWSDCLDVISNLMTYMNCNIIQVKDAVYITSPDAVANHRGYYFKHTFNSDERPLVLVDELYDISDGELGEANTNISTTSTYKKVKVSTNEYYDDNLALDFDSDYIDPYNEWDTMKNFLKVTDVDRNVASTAHPFNYDMEETASATFSGAMLQYNPDPEINLPYVQCYSYWRDGQRTGFPDYLWIKTNQTSNATTWSECADRAGCSLVEFGCNEISTDNAMSDYFKNYEGKRVFLFHTTANQIQAGAYSHSKSPLKCDSYYITNESFQETKKMLYIETKKTYIKSSQSLQIQGDWTFFQNQTLPLESGWAVDQLKACKPYMYIWMKIAIPVGDTKYYLHNTNSSQYYSWNTTEGWCKVWYDNFAGIDSDANRRNRREQMTKTNAFETTFSFTKNTRGAEGTCIPLPSSIEGTYTHFEITIGRPYGCAREKSVANTDFIFYCPQYTVLENFKVNVIDSEETNYNFDTNFNNEFIGDAYDLAIDDFQSIDIQVSSDYFKNSSKATVIGILNNRLNNTASGWNSLPEANIISDIVRTYINSRLRLDITLPNEVSPLTLIQWSTQFENKNFIVDSLSIDYSLSDYKLSLFEKTLDDIEPHIYSEKKTRNYRRNGDNEYNPLPRKNKKDIENPQEGRFVLILFSTNATTGTTYVSGSLLRDIHFEPYFRDGEMYLYSPNYLDDIMGVSVNDEGQIIINY